MHRHVYYCSRCRRIHAPLDSELQLDDTQYSKGARFYCVYTGAALPYKEAADLLKEISAVDTDASMIKSFCDAAGQRLEEDVVEDIKEPLTHADPSKNTKELLYITLDGANVPIRDKERPWQEVRVGVVYTAQKVNDELRIDFRENFAYLGTMEDFGPRLWNRAAANGVCEAKNTVFISDGAPANWSIADMYFPEARQILDFYHVTEHLNKVSTFLYFADDPQRKVWVDDNCHNFKIGRWKKVIEDIRSKTPLPEKENDVQKEINYFCNNRHRMHYLHYRRCGLYIGSGVVESACKQIVQQRIRVAGARWHPDTCQGMLHLRCAHLTRKDILYKAA